jgi:putative hemolysin
MVEWLLFHGLLIAFFILANSFFVAAEFAMVSVLETHIEQLVAAGRPGARTVRALKENIDEFLPAVQFGVTIAALALGGIGEPSIAEALQRVLARLHLLHLLGTHQAEYVHGAAIVLAFALITYLEVLLGELVPKSLALQRAERIALAVAAPMDIFIRMTRPAVRLMNGSASLVLKLFHAPLRGEGAAHSPEELKLMATATRRMGLLPAFQEEMIHRAIELNRTVTREIMTPRGRIFSLPADLPLERASARIVDEQHSRVPVYDPARGREHIVGVVYSKDVSRLMHARAAALALGSRGASGLTLGQVMRDVLVVPETKPAADLLHEFQQRRRQLAIVVDEFGTTVGLVTAEDALEQVVGELEDEFDVVSAPVIPTADRSVMLDGAAPLRDLVTQMRWTFPRRDGIETLAGFLMAELGHIPAAGESVEHDGRRFVIAEMAGHRVATVRVLELPKKAGLEGAKHEGAKHDVAKQSAARSDVSKVDIKPEVSKREAASNMREPAVEEKR